MSCLFTPQHATWNHTHTRSTIPDTPALHHTPLHHINYVNTPYTTTPHFQITSPHHTKQHHTYTVLQHTTLLYTTSQSSQVGNWDGLQHKNLLVKWLDQWKVNIYLCGFRRGCVRLERSEGRRSRWKGNKNKLIRDRENKKWKRGEVRVIRQWYW